MAKKKDLKDKTEDRIVAVEEALGKGEQFIEKNKNLLFYILLGILLIIGGYLGYRKFILGPKQQEAQAQMFTAEMYFERDSLNLALNGDGTNPGFLQIIDEYSATKSGNLARYYAGICYLKLGEFENAINHLKDFDSEDLVLGAMALGAIGDCYIELGDNEKALKHYLDAANLNANDFTSPMFLMKAGWTYELMGNYDKAIETYEKLKKEHYRSNESRDVEKYIARAKGLAGKS
jgi:tetratricopeptide (TPR) repeat protein